VNLRSKLPPKLQKFTTRGALIKLPMLPFALIVVGIFILLRPFVIIQIYKVHDWRIGHMVTTTQLTTLEIKEWNSHHLRKKIVLYFFASNKCANEIYRNFLRREHISIVGHWGFLLFYISHFFKHFFLIPQPITIDRHGLILKHPVAVKFNDSEFMEGTRFLESCGLTPNGKYVCLNVRDSAFLSKTRRKDFNKHNLRNSDINSYIGVVKVLTELGYSVFRMGSIVEMRLDFEDQKFFDYASNGMRTEFLDIFLGATCTFCISTGTGWDEIPRIFKRPTMIVNCLPILSPEIITRDILLFPKYMRDKDTNKLLSLNECLSSGLYELSNPEWVQKYNGIAQDLSFEDLSHAVNEMVARVEGRFTPTLKQIQLQDLLRRKLTARSKLQPSEGYFPIRAEFATRFLIQNPNFLD
jgi:putative glycosyltransferase (TIGR04372 family)